MNTGIYNCLYKNYIWYHCTPPERVNSILKEGLKINSMPTYQDCPEPWIYVSSKPFFLNLVVLTIDLSYLPWDKAGWPFGEEEKPIEERIQLRILEDIPVKYINIA